MREKLHELTTRRRVQEATQEDDVKMEEDEDMVSDVKMGEDEEAMEYDADLIFKHL